jgi:hypothetical protein
LREHGPAAEAAITEQNFAGGQVLPKALPQSNFGSARNDN